MKKLGVVGSGNMGNGIGQCGAQNGYDVVLYDVAEAQLEKAKSHIESSLRKRVEKGKMAQEEMDRTLANIRGGEGGGEAEHLHAAGGPGERGVPAGHQYLQPVSG